MTDLLLVAVLVFMAVLLGAAVLAIVLLYHGWRTNRALITDLKAQLAAQQIANLTGSSPPTTGATPATAEPARRRRHLALYLGGGVAAAFVTCREGILRAVRARPALTTAAMATVATVSTAATLALVPGDSSGQGRPTPSTASTDHPQSGSLTPPSPGVDPSTVETDNGAALPDGTVAAGDPPGRPVWESGTSPSADGTASPGSSSSPAGEPEGGKRQGGSGPSAVPPDPVQDDPGAAQPPADAPPAAEPQPGTPPPAPQDPPTPPKKDDTGLCVKLPPVVGLCLLGGP